MTNEVIIFEQSQRLLRAGILKGTGEFVTATVQDADGNIKEIEMEMPEPIHTYQMWKTLGFQVKKGQKAIASFVIWKHTVRHDTETDEDEEHMFMKKAAFFTRAQVEAIG